MTAADYRAEARAWRRRAHWIDRHTEWWFLPEYMVKGMSERWRHVGADHESREAGVWFCLILALEAEDDARRAER